MKILICSDGSERALKTLEFAARLAEARGTETTIFGITEEESEEERMLESLRDARKMLRARGIAVESTTKQGEPVREIIERTREAHYDLVVIGAEHKGQRGDACLLSGKACKIIEAVAPPVLAVMGQARPGLKKILICSGGGNYIENAVKFTAGIARDAAASITLLSVLPKPPAIHASMETIEADTSRLLTSDSSLGKNLRAEKQAIESFGVAGAVRIRHGLVIDEILAEVQEGDYDLVVAGSWPLADPIRRYVMGDVTREIVNQMDRPLLVIRSDKKAISMAGRLWSAAKRMVGRK